VSSLGEEFKANPVYLIPILASLIIGLACAYLLGSIPVAAPPVIPFPDTPSGSISNAIYFLAIIATSAAIFYLLIRWKRSKTIGILVAFAISAASILLSAVYLSALLSSIPNWEIIAAISAILITVLVDLIIFKVGGKAQSVVVVALGGALGVFLGYSIPLWSSILILVFLAAYDIVAVYKGPIGKIADSGLDQLKGLSFSFKHLQMGLGDLVFYSMLCGTMFLKIGWFSYFFSLVGIVIGTFVTFKLLEKKEIFPGLPLPILLGLSGGLLGSLLPG